MAVGGVEVVGLALAAVAIPDLALNYGGLLMQTVSAFKNADDEIKQRIVLLESCWMRTTSQLNSLQQIWNELEELHRTVQSELLHIIITKLAIATSKLKGFLKEDKTYSSFHVEGATGADNFTLKVKRVKYAALRRFLDEFIDELETWQRRFDPSWFLIARIESRLVDMELGSINKSSHPAITTTHRVRDSIKDNNSNSPSIFLAQDGLKSAKFVDIPYMTVQLVQRAGSSKWRLVDTVPCEGNPSLHLIRQDIRDLARKLHESEPITFSLLKCYGVIAEASPATNQISAFKIVFDIPHGLSSPQSLRATILTTPASHSLSARLSLAKQLARAVCYMHSYKFVHKNIRPETILNFTSNNSNGAHQSPLGSVFLLGFEKFRASDGRTLLRGDFAWERNLYRHPQRQGVQLHEAYVMQHDIYSLGVCLLELGMWESFVVYDEHGGGGGLGEPALRPSTALGLGVDGAELKQGVLLKEHLVGLCRRQLPSRMGSRFAGIVENCLTCLDADNVDFGDQTEFLDRDGVLIAVRYIDKVLGHLDSISI